MGSYSLSKAQCEHTLETVSWDIPNFAEMAEKILSEGPRNVEKISTSYDVKGHPQACSILVGEIMALPLVEGIKLYCSFTMNWASAYSSRYARTRSLTFKFGMGLWLITPDGKQLIKESGEEYRQLEDSESGNSDMVIKLDEVKDALDGCAKLAKDLVARVELSFTYFGTENNSHWTKIEPLASRKALPFAGILAEKKLADLTVECQGTEYPAHSLILKSVSPVFKCMLESVMKEALSSCIVISDVEPETVEQMLEYIYTGNFARASITDELLIQLLHCADKYQFAQLKNMVISQILSNISVQNAIKFVRAAKMYGAEKKFVEALMQFCKANLSSFPKDDTFKEFMMENMDVLI